MFSQVFPMKGNIEDLTDIYFNSFKRISEKSLRNAAYECIETCEFFPKPKDVFKFIKTDEHDKELRNRFTCSICKNHVSLLIEGVCSWCKAGVPLSIERPVLAHEEFSEVVDSYLIEHLIKCQKCGKVTTCVKEPPESGQWLCRECFTGLTLPEFEAKLHDLIDKIKEVEPKSSKTKRAFSAKHPFELSPDVVLERKGELAQQYNELKTEDEDIPF